MVYFDGLSTRQVLRKCHHYNKADHTYYMHDPSRHFDWCIPKKIYIEAKEHGRRLPEGVPYPAPRDDPGHIDHYGVEPGKHTSSSSNFTHILRRSLGGTRWKDHEAQILWNKYRVLRGRLDRNPQSERNRVSRVQKYQIHSYDVRSNKWQVLSKMHRIGQLDKDWRACDYYISKAVSTTIKKNGHFPKNRKYNLPSSASVLEYLWENHRRRNKPDENLRQVLSCLFIAATTSGYDRRHHRTGGLPDHMPSVWKNFALQGAMHSGHRKHSKPLSPRRLRVKVGDGCKYHCHKKRLASECKRRSLKKYHGSTHGTHGGHGHEHYYRERAYSPRRHRHSHRHHGHHHRGHHQHHYDEEFLF